MLTFHTLKRYKAIKFMELIVKNPAAVALGRLAKGKPKTGLSRKELLRRRIQALANAAAMKGKKRPEKKVESFC